MVEMTDELIENVMYLIDSKKGDIGRLNYILSALQDGKSLYNSDKKYLDSLLSTYMRRSEQKSLEILHGKSSTEYRGSNHYKSEGTALVLSLLFGLLGIMGLGHRYVGHVTKSLAILYLGWTLLFLNFLTGIFTIIYPMIFPQSTIVNPFLLSLSLTTVLANKLNLDYFWSSILTYTIFIAVSGGYFALYIWQIFDSRNITRRFNRIMDQTGEQLYKMTIAKKISYILIALGPIYAVILISLAPIIEAGINSTIHTNPFLIQLEMKLDSLIGIKH
jgi:hypothetical protein